jgi:gas vesicle protein
MNYAAAAEALMRRKLLEEMYDRMTDEEKRLFVQMTMQQRSANEIKKVLQEQSAQLQDLRHRQQTFSQDFLSNILGNATWDGVMWVVGKLIKAVR